MSCVEALERTMRELERERERERERRCNLAHIAVWMMYGDARQIQREDALEKLIERYASFLADAQGLQRCGRSRS